MPPRKAGTAYRILALRTLGLEAILDFGIGVLCMSFTQALSLRQLTQASLVLGSCGQYVASVYISCWDLVVGITWRLVDSIPTVS